MNPSWTVATLLFICAISSTVQVTSGYVVQRSIQRSVQSNTMSPDYNALYSLMERLLGYLRQREQDRLDATSAADQVSRGIQRGHVIPLSSVSASASDETGTLDDRILVDESNRPKRRWDAGYASRYQSAARIGAKIMALKEAADWNGPGRKR